MSVYNDVAHLPAAVESVLGQTFTDFEFIIVDDGSTDGTAAILDRFDDPHIVRLRHARNLGLTRALNRGLEVARGKYVARMDSDDISLPERLEKQIAFMEAHPQVGLCGTWCQTVGSQSRIGRYPVSDEEIRWALIVTSVFAHSTVMMRKSVLDEHGLRYDPACAYAQDHDLWVRLAQYTQLANLPEVLLHYRVHPDQVTRRHRNLQLTVTSQGGLRQVQALGLLVTLEEAAVHRAIFGRDYEHTVGFVVKAEGWLRKLSEFARSRSGAGFRVIAPICAANLFVVCNQATECGWRVWRTFWHSPLSQYAGIGRMQRLKFAVKCALRWKGRRVPRGLKDGI